MISKEILATSTSQNTQVIGGLKYFHGLMELICSLREKKRLNLELLHILFPLLVNYAIKNIERPPYSVTVSS